jgi:hypothetical protein
VPIGIALALYGWSVAASAIWWYRALQSRITLTSSQFPDGSEPLLVFGGLLQIANFSIFALLLMRAGRDSEFQHRNLATVAAALLFLSSLAWGIVPSLATPLLAVALALTLHLSRQRGDWRDEPVSAAGGDR